MTVLLVTGTDTGVGKTIVTAAVAACAMAHGDPAGGRSVAVIKPAQTGIPAGSAEPSDVDVVRRLARPTSATTLVSYPDPLAPWTASVHSGLPPLRLGDVADAVRSAGDKHDVVLVEGAGGLLVRMGDGWTVADLAVALRIPAVVVVRAGLGTLNHTALTLEAMARRSIPGWLVLGSWPARPELVHWTNLTDLLVSGPAAVDLAGAVPEGAGQLRPDLFRAAAPGWLTPSLFGRADPTALRCDPSSPQAGGADPVSSGPADGPR